MSRSTAPMRCLFTGLALALTSSCDSSSTGAPSIVEREGEPPVVVFSPDDRALSDAIAEARGSVDDFIAELPRLQADGMYVSVKAPVPTEDDVEHIWLDDLDYREGAFHGTLGNEPLSTELSFGDPYSISAHEISDWMAIRDDELFGGFTIFVARDALDEAQRASFSEGLGFRMPETPQTF